MLDRPGSLNKLGQMLLGDPRPRHAAGGYADANGAVIGLDLDDEEPHEVDTPGLPALSILRIFRHRRSDVVVEPVVLVLLDRRDPRHDGRTQVTDGCADHEDFPLGVGAAGREVRPPLLLPFISSGRTAHTRSCQQARRGAASPVPAYRGPWPLLRRRPDRARPARPDRRHRP